MASDRAAAAEARRDRRLVRACPKEGLKVVATKIGKGMRLELAMGSRGRPLADVTARANVVETNLA